MKKNDCRAVVITEDHYNALGIMRSLGEAGLPITLILLTTRETYVDLCRYVSDCIKIEKNETEIVNLILNEAKSREKCVLFPLCDYAANIVDRNYCAFPENVLSPNIGGSMWKYLDKNTMKMIAASCNIHVPEGKVAIMGSQVEWNRFPAIIKPLLSIEGVKSDISIVGNKEELTRALDSMKKKDYERVLIEEYIDGIDSHMVEVLGYRDFKKNTVICGIVKKIREYPIKNGSTSYAEIVDSHNDVKKEAIEKMLDTIGYCGIWDIEYKYKAGKAYFIECNFRNGAPSYALTRVGINLPIKWIEANNICKIDDYRHAISVKRLFMCEQNDLINMVKGYVNPVEWFKEYTTANKVFGVKHDMHPVRKYYWMLLKQVMKKG